MAEVFRGVAESLQGFRKSVAIKRVLPALTKNKKFVAMFLDEARLSLYLQHANVVQMFDIGQSDETYFIVMEFVDGVDLKALLEWRRRINKRLTIGQTIYIIMEVCKGLAYAHELTHPENGKPLGIVHRDVSPPNVLFSKNGEVKLADFGLAKAASQLEATDPGVVKGKMSYLSPEAARGEDVDHRADIFAVGILLYEMLTGKRLFYGESDYQTVELVRAAKIPPIAKQNPEVEPEIEEICRKALARRVEDRFQSATDLQDALAHYLFSRGLKMIQRDIADLVRSCIEDLATLSGARKPKPNIIDTLLHEEIHAFTSVDFEQPGMRPLMVTEQPPSASGGGRGMEEFVDPRAWADDADWPGRRTGGGRSGAAGGDDHRGSAAQGGNGASPSGGNSGGNSDGNSGGKKKSQNRRQDSPSASEPRGNQRPNHQASSGPMPTPGPEMLAEVLEPAAPAAAPVGPRPLGRGALIGIILGAVAVGALAASLFGAR